MATSKFKSAENAYGHLVDLGSSDMPPKDTTEGPGTPTPPPQYSYTDIQQPQPQWQPQLKQQQLQQQQQQQQHQQPQRQPQLQQQPPQWQTQQQASTTVIVQQPQSLPPLVKVPRVWSSSMCSCCDDMGICLCGTFCLLCLQCQIASDMGESSCVPCCVPGAAILLRSLWRTRHNIQGSVMDDCCVVVCCHACAMCQLARDMKFVELNQEIRQYMMA